MGTAQLQDVRTRMQGISALLHPEVLAAHDNGGDFLLGGAGKKKAAAGKPVPGKPGKAAAGASTVSEWNPANMGMNVPDCGPLGGNCAIWEAEEDNTTHPIEYY